MAIVHRLDLVSAPASPGQVNSKAGIVAAVGAAGGGEAAFTICPGRDGP